ncbi:hypothetical protein BDQ12DRAFT_587515, partial [Crucibulum laeve]
MSSHAKRLAHIFTPEYVRRINVQMAYPAFRSQLVKPYELLSALAGPLQIAAYEPERSVTYPATTFSYSIIMDAASLHERSKHTGFFLANEYLRAQGLPGL